MRKVDGPGTKTGALKEKIDAYFAACDQTEETFELKSGGTGRRQTPYTLAGLAEQLGEDKCVIRQKAEGTGRMAKLYANAMRRIERYIVERTLLGELQHSVAAKLLSDLGAGTGTLSSAGEGESGPDGEDNRIVIVMDDPEDWSK